MYVFVSAECCPRGVACVIDHRLFVRTHPSRTTSPRGRSLVSGGHQQCSLSSVFGHSSSAFVCWSLVVGHLCLVSSLRSFGRWSSFCLVFGLGSSMFDQSSHAVRCIVLACIALCCVALLFFVLHCCVVCLNLSPFSYVFVLS